MAIGFFHLVGRYTDEALPLGFRYSANNFNSIMVSYKGDIVVVDNNQKKTKWRVKTKPLLEKIKEGFLLNIRKDLLPDVVNSLNDKELLIIEIEANGKTSVTWNNNNGVRETRIIFADHYR